MQSYTEALNIFQNLHAQNHVDTEVIHHIADTYDKLGDNSKALEWFNRLIVLNPLDSTVLMSIARLYDVMGDKSQAFHFYSEVSSTTTCNVMTNVDLPKLPKQLGTTYLAEYIFRRTREVRKGYGVP